MASPMAGSLLIDIVHRTPFTRVCSFPRLLACVAHLRPSAHGLVASETQMQRSKKKKRHTPPGQIRKLPDSVAIEVLVKRKQAKGHKSPSPHKLPSPTTRKANFARPPQRHRQRPQRTEVPEHRWAHDEHVDELTQGTEDPEHRQKTSRLCGPTGGPQRTATCCKQRLITATDADTKVVVAMLSRKRGRGPRLATAWTNADAPT